MILLLIMMPCEIEVVVEVVVMEVGVTLVLEVGTLYVALQHATNVRILENDGDY